MGKSAAPASKIQELETKGSPTPEEHPRRAAQFHLPAGTQRPLGNPSSCSLAAYDCPSQMGKYHILAHYAQCTLDIDLAVARYVGATAPASSVRRDIILPGGGFMSAVIGPRRAGRTTFMLQLMDGLALPPSDKVFVNGEDVGLRDDRGRPGGG